MRRGGKNSLRTSGAVLGTALVLGGCTSNNEPAFSATPSMRYPYASTIEGITKPVVFASTFDHYPAPSDDVSIDFSPSAGKTVYDKSQNDTVICKLTFEGLPFRQFADIGREALVALGQGEEPTIKAPAVAYYG